MTLKPPTQEILTLEKASETNLDPDQVLQHEIDIKDNDDDEDDDFTQMGMEEASYIAVFKFKLKLTKRT